MLFLLFALAARAELRAGAAKADITPDVQAQAIPLGGYAARKGARATGVHDPVYARALVLSQGNEKVGIVSLDLCFLPANVKSEVEKRLEARKVLGLSGTHLFLAATHTHTAPDPLAMHSGNTFDFPGWSKFDPALLAFTAERIADAVEKAERQQRAARAGSGVEKLASPPLNRNRRGDPIIDPDLTYLKVTDANGKPIAAIINFAAHPTLYDDDMRDISADWPGVMTAQIETKLGDGAVCLFLNGAEGDASPNGAIGKTESEKVEDYGKRMANVALPKLNAMATNEANTLHVWSQKIVLPPRKPNVLFLLAAGQLGISSVQAKTLVNGLMPTETQIAFVQLGNLLLMGFPCEPSGALGLAAKAKARTAGFSRPAVIALTNDWLAYALTPEQYRAGKYETGMSFFGSEFGPLLLKSLSAGLNARRTTESASAVAPKSAKPLFTYHHSPPHMNRPLN